MTVVTTPPAARTPITTWAAAAAGLVAAGVALAFGELVAGVTDRVPSLVIAVGELVVDRTPGDLVETGIEASGTNDKPILIGTIVVLALALGAWLGTVAVRRPRAADLGFLAFGVFGAWAAARNPFSSVVPSWLTSLAAAMLAIGVRRVLFAAASLPSHAVPERSRRDELMPGRRAFLALGAAGGVAAIGAASVGRALQRARNVAGIRSAIMLPPAMPVDLNAMPSTLDDSVPGISPYLTPNGDFYRIDTALTVPQIDPADWRLRITGLVEEPYELTYDEILAMDLVETTVTLSCVSNEVGGRLVGNAKWLGVPLTTLLDRARPKPDGTQIVGVSEDDFDAGFPTELAYDGRTALLAVGMNGEPLPVRHGFPARLVVSGLYGYVSAVKWIREIRLDTDDHDAYWVPRGWSKLGPVKTQSRIDVPRRGAELERGQNPIAGVAWAPSVGVEAVEVRIDDGPWRLCRLGGATSDDTWVQWLLEWEATPGPHTIEVRATDKNGTVQTDEPSSPRPNGATGHHRVRVNVS